MYIRACNPLGKVPIICLKQRAWQRCTHRIHVYVLEHTVVRVTVYRATCTFDTGSVNACTRRHTYTYIAYVCCV